MADRDVALYGLSVLISLIWYRKGYVYRYTIENGWLKVNKGFVPMSHEMIVNERIGSGIDLKKVSYLIDTVYQILKQECVNLKDKV